MVEVTASISCKDPFTIFEIRCCRNTAFIIDDSAAAYPKKYFEKVACSHTLTNTGEAQSALSCGYARKNENPIVQLIKVFNDYLSTRRVQVNDVLSFVFSSYDKAN